MYEEDGKKEKDLLAKIRSLLPEMTEAEIESLKSNGCRVEFDAEMMERKGA